MESSNKNSSSLRYLKARLQPFMQPMFWGPPSVLALVVFCIVQYINSPELLDATIEQPPVSQDGITDGPVEPVLELEDTNNNQVDALFKPLPLENSEASESPQEKLPLDSVEPVDTSELDFLPETNPEATLPQQSSPTSKSKQKEQPQNQTTNSLFLPLPGQTLIPNKSQTQQSAPKPIESSSAKNLFNSQPATAGGNPLQQALQQLPPPVNNNYPQQQNQVQPQIPPYQNPYNNSPVQPNPVQPPIQSYQPPYNNSPGQPNQNNTNQPQTDYNSSPVQTPQIQQPINFDSPDFER